MACDIVGSLPLELLILVVGYLDLKDILRCGAVSKRWRTAFCCKRVIKPMLLETIELLGLDQEGVDIESAMPDAMRYFRWRLGLEHARPVQKIFLPWPEHIRKLPDHIRYHSRRLCYVNLESSGLEMVDLETGEKSIWADDEADSYWCPILSDRILVVVTHRRHEGLRQHLTAWNIHTKQKLSQETPIYFFPRQIFGDKVVSISNAYSGDFYLDLPLAHVWDLTLNHAQDIGPNYFYPPTRMSHVDAFENSLGTFDISTQPQKVTVTQTKWKTTTGEQLDTKAHTICSPVASTVIDRPRFPNRYSTCHTFGHNKTVSLNLMWVPETKEDVAIHLEYDAAADRLSSQWIRNAKYDHAVYLTANVAYLFSTETSQVGVFNVTTGKVTVHPVQSSTSSTTFPQQWRRTDSNNQSGRDVQVFGDREAFGWADDYGLHVWVFNPSFVVKL